MSQVTPDPVVQTLLEALSSMPPVPTLLWGRGLGPVSRTLAPDVTVHTLLQDARDRSAVRGPTSFGMEAPDGAFQRVLMRLPRSRDALRWRLAAAASALPPDGELVLAGHQREGIKSSIKTLEELVGPVVTARIKRRCRVLVAHRRAQVSPPPGLDEVARTVDFEASGKQLSAVTLPGVFAHGRVDEGTRRMLAWLEAEPPSGRVLDLGAGAGILGLACAAYPGVTEVLVNEVMWAGFEACRRTIAANQGAGLAPVSAEHADVLAASDGPFDLVVTNPPFHDGREEDRQLISRFAEAAAARLRPSGRLLAVCNRHLAYREALGGHFGDVAVVWEDNRFRVWSSGGPRR